jgi:hypothetical protein
VTPRLVLQVAVRDPFFYIYLIITALMVAVMWAIYGPVFGLLMIPVSVTAAMIGFAAGYWVDKHR